MTQVTSIAICMGALLILALVWMVAKKVMFFVMTAFFAFAMYNNTQTMRTLKDLGLRFGEVDKGQIQDSRPRAVIARHPATPHGHPRSDHKRSPHQSANEIVIASVEQGSVPGNQLGAPGGNAATDAGHSTTHHTTYNAPARQAAAGPF